MSRNYFFRAGYLMKTSSPRSYHPAIIRLSGAVRTPKFYQILLEDATVRTALKIQVYLRCIRKIA